ncbi:MAG: hypothetical protein EOP00_07555 [Pedobacter sp.]|nr:MAG: hypothetical protein EOP00_07555 [Pedobacter sp.]
MTVKQVSITLAIALLCCSSILTSAQNVKFKWNAENEKKALSAYTTQLRKLPLSEAQVKDLSHCSLTKVKAKYPNGINMSEQQFMEVNDDILFACVQEAKLIVIPPISNELALTLKNQVFEKLDQSISETTKLKLSDCFVSTVMAKYPKGVIFKEADRNLFKEAMFLISSNCAEQMSLAGITEWNTETESLFKYGFTKDIAANGASAYAHCLLEKFKSKFPKGYVVNEKNKAAMNNTFEQLKLACKDEITTSN